MNYLRSTDYDTFYIIGSKNRYGEITRNLVIQELIANGINSTRVPYRDLVSKNSSYLDEVITEINNYPNSVIIITAEDTFQKEIFESFNVNNINYANGHLIISFTLSSVLIYQLGYSNLDKTMFFVHGYDDFSNSITLDKRYSASVNGIVAEEFPLPSSFSIIADAIQQLMKSFTVSGSELPSEYGSYIFHQITNIPSAGPYEIYYNGLAQCQYRILQVDGTNQKFELISEDTFSMRAYVYPNENKDCDLRDEELIKASESMIIGVLFDIRSTEGAERWNEVQLVVELINQDGGIDGVLLDVEQNNYDGDYNNIVQYATELMESYNVVAYIGASTIEERKAIEEYLEEKGVLLFCIFSSFGEEVYKNIIMVL